MIRVSRLAVFALAAAVAAAPAFADGKKGPPKYIAPPIAPLKPPPPEAPPPPPPAPPPQPVGLTLPSDFGTGGVGVHISGGGGGGGPFQHSGIRSLEFT